MPITKSQVSVEWVGRNDHAPYAIDGRRVLASFVRNEGGYVVVFNDKAEHGKDASDSYVVAAVHRGGDDVLVDVLRQDLAYLPAVSIALLHCSADPV